MIIHRLNSDQLITWSDVNARYFIVRFAQTSREVAAANACFGYLVAWLAHRALQALWQTRLQMCRWPGTWPQVLSVGEFPRLSASDGLCAASGSGRCRRTPGELPPRPRNHRGDLRNQPRTVTPPRGTLRTPGEPVSAATHPHHRSAIGRRTHCQHARGLAFRRVWAGAERGGRR